MRKIFTGVLLTLLFLSVVPLVGANPAAQFSGCADEVDEEVGVRVTALGMNGVDFEVIVVGLDDFDPEITILNADGEVVTCNNDARDGAEVEVNLPSITAGPSETTAIATTRVGGDERLDLEVIISSANDTSGEFIALISGPSIAVEADNDNFQINTNEAMVEAGVPLGVYAVNLGLPRNPLNPSITFSFGEDFEQSCSASSSSQLCEGDSEDLGGTDSDGNPFFVQFEADTPIELTGNDVMLYFEAGGEPATFDVEIGSSANSSTGPFYFLLHSGVSYPETEE